jgi:hypothetical protein
MCSDVIKGGFLSMINPSFLNGSNKLDDMKICIQNRISLDKNFNFKQQ